jgi:predicted ferric reductase
MRRLILWAVITTAIVLPVIFAAFSPQLAWRDPIYIVAGFAGIIAMSLMALQPLLAGGRLPNIHAKSARLLHRAIGAALVCGIIIHVAGLWITSPPDVIDALLLRSPTSFSIWGVLAMWAAFATATLAVIRKRLSPRIWRLVHTSVAVIIVTATCLHVLLIEGTMEPYSKIALCLFLAITTLTLLFRRNRWHHRA